MPVPAALCIDRTGGLGEPHHPVETVVVGERQGLDADLDEALTAIGDRFQPKGITVMEPSQPQDLVTLRAWSARGGAALDVVENEPIAADNPLPRMDNVLVTPHLATRSIQSTENSKNFVVANITRLARGEAMRQAEVALIDGPGFIDSATRQTAFAYAHPIFWAPFSLVGDGGG